MGKQYVRCLTDELIGVTKGEVYEIKDGVISDNGVFFIENDFGKEDHWWLAESDFKLVDKPKQSRRKCRPLTDEEKKYIDERPHQSSRSLAKQLWGKSGRKSTINDYRASQRVSQKNPSRSKISKQTGPKVLFLDIENSPTLSRHFGRFNINVGQDNVIEESYLFGLVAKWMGEDRTIEIYPKVFDNWSNEEEQIGMLTRIRDLLDQCDFTVAHNSAFDTKVLNAYFIRYGIAPPSPYRTICTLKMAKSVFRFPSNKLDSIGQYLEVGRKMPHTGIDLWVRCCRGEKEAFKSMIAYNEIDVLLLEEIYNKLKPYVKNHPNFSVYTDAEIVRCGVCLSENIKYTDKKAYTNLAEYDVFKCNDCGTYHRDRSNNLSKEQRGNLLSGNV